MEFMVGYSRFSIYEIKFKLLTTSWRRIRCDFSHRFRSQVFLDNAKTTLLKDIQIIGGEDWHHPHGHVVSMLSPILIILTMVMLKYTRTELHDQLGSKVNLTHILPRIALQVLSQFWLLLTTNNINDYCIFYAIRYTW